MGGVDRADQFCSFYTVGRQSQKWYRYIFWFVFNVPVCNAYILECKHRQRNHQRTRSQATFRLELGKHLINGYSYWKRPANQAPAQQPRRDHQAGQIENRKECVLCRAAGRKTPKGYPIETRNKCQQCDVALYKVRCFAEYHSAADAWTQNIFKFFCLWFTEWAQNVNRQEKRKVSFISLSQCTFWSNKLVFCFFDPARPRNSARGNGGKFKFFNELEVSNDCT